MRLGQALQLLLVLFCSGCVTSRRASSAADSEPPASKASEPSAPVRYAAPGDEEDLPPLTGRLAAIDLPDTASREISVEPGKKVSAGLDTARAREALSEYEADHSAPSRNPAEVWRTVKRHQPAFQRCIDRELKRNPEFKGGKVQLLASLASSGKVTRARIDPVDVDRSEVGRCLKDRARRMVFSKSKGREETDVEIPLVLSGG